MDFKTGAVPITAIEGIGPSYARILSRFNIRTSGDFLRKTIKPRRRHRLSKRTGISEKRIERWASMCDLARIEGITDYSGSLVDSGVNSVKNLADANLVDLWARLSRKDSSKRPTKSQLIGWQSSANSLKPLIPEKKEKPVKKEAKMEVHTPRVEIKKASVIRENIFNRNHVGMFEKSTLLISGVILIAMLIMYVLIIINPAFA